MKVSPNFKVLEKLEKEENPNLNKIFLNLINELKTYLRIDPVNNNVVIHLEHNNVNKINQLGYDISRYLKEGKYHIRISNYKFIPFFFLESAYLCFIPNHQKESR